jgi:F-type H+-transporting ATPase subunit alpha
MQIIDKELSNTGVVISVGCGVVTLQGFLLAYVGELFKVSSYNAAQVSLGIVVNLYRDPTLTLIIGALLINPANRLSEGAQVIGQCTLSSIIIGDYAIGSILDALGNLILNSRRVDVQYRWVIESPAPGIIYRQSVFEPLQTGVLSIDSMIPIGRGQRELIVGDRQIGKTSLGVDVILNQKLEKVLCVYVALGQKASSILDIFLALLRRDAVFYLSLVVASASSSAVCQYLSAYTGSALSEFLMLVGELPSFVMYDDLSRHAVAYREIYLLLRRPPGREAYPGEIFFVHSRLLERSAKLATALGGGSSTAFPVIETLAGDVSAYITTNVISITDGQIFLSTALFLAGIKPAIDVGLSVTRVGSAAQWDGMKLVAGSYKLELAQFVELQSFSQFAADLGEETKKRLARGLRLVELLKQVNGSPLCLANQLGVLSLANQDLIKRLAIKEVGLLLNLYSLVPVWTMILVPARIIGASILSVIKNCLALSET